jgi:hypothetical protein
VESPHCLARYVAAATLLRLSPLRLPGEQPRAPPPPRVQVLGFRGSGFRAQGLGFRVDGSGFRIQDLGFRAQGLGFRVWGLGFSV